MRSVVFELPLNHRFCAIVSSVACVRRRNANVQGRLAITESLREDVSGSQVRAWDKTRNLRLCTGVTSLHPRQHLVDNAVVAASALSDGAACRVGARAIEKEIATPSARDRLRRASATKSHANGFQELFVAEEWSMMLAQVS